ncbi:MAG TPA: hypothetical protein VIX87_04615 [Steroidobacteraceae bacterium]
MNWPATSLRVAADHPALSGHFPQQPIVPGALLLDEALYAIEQAGALDAPPAAPATPSAGSTWQLTSVKFHRVVAPGETLRLECGAQPDGGLRCEWRAAHSVVMSATLARRDA